MLQEIIDITEMAPDTDETVKNYLSRVAEMYDISLSHLVYLMEKAIYGTGLTYSEEHDFQALLETLKQAVLIKQSSIPAEVSALPETSLSADMARFYAKIRLIISWRPTTSQLATVGPLLLLYGVSLFINLQNQPTSFWEQDSAWTFSELVHRFPVNWDSFSSIATTPLGLLSHPHGIIQFIPGLILIPIVELFNLPLTDGLLSTFYIVIGTAIVIPIYMIGRMMSGSRVVGLMSVLLVMLLPGEISWLRQGGELHASFALGFQILVLYAFYKYGQAPSTKRAWIVGMVLGAQWLTDVSFFLILPAALFALLSAKQGSFRQRCFAAIKDILHPGVWVLPVLVIAFQLLVYFYLSPPPHLSVLGSFMSKSQQYPFALRLDYLWNLLVRQAPGPLPIAILLVSLFGLWYVVKLHRNGILLLWGWAYLGLFMLKIPRDISSSWNVFGVLPLVILVLVITWLISQGATKRYKLPHVFSIIIVSVVFITMGLPLIININSIHSGMYSYSYETQEAGVKSSAAYVRSLPYQGGNVVVWGVRSSALLFYFTQSTVSPQMEPEPLSEVAVCLEKISAVSDTFVIFNVGLKRWYPDAEDDDFYKPEPPFYLVTTVEDEAGTLFASIYRRTYKYVEPVVWGLAEGNRVFDTQFSRLEDLRQGPWGLAYVRTGDNCSSFPGNTEYFDQIRYEQRVAAGQPLPSNEDNNLHSNSSVEDDLSFHGQGVRATLEQSDDWAAEGSYSVKVTVIEASESHQGQGTGYSDAITALPNTEYTASVMVKSLTVGQLSIAVREFDNGGNHLAYTICSGELVYEPPTWLALTFTTGPDTAMFSVEVRSKNIVSLEEGFIYYFDNVQVWATGQ